MGELEGRVAIVTGAGQGIGRAHARHLASLGARVVVNDVCRGDHGVAGDGPAQQVVDEITAGGGLAVANGEDVSSWEGAKRLIDAAIASFGALHIVVNNAGIIRDRTLVKMDEPDWDSVIGVHLRGHMCVLHWAACHWRDQAKDGHAVSASVVNTTSGSGLFGNPGQANYSAAKAAIASLTLVAARELQRYGVRVNAIAPVARTQMTEGIPALAERFRAPEGADFDRWSPDNIAPLVAYLATEDCPLTGQILAVHGDSVSIAHGWTIGEHFTTGNGRWTVDGLRDVLRHVDPGPPALVKTT
jgi:NAD(P)-dependent dehydrogenase (short-subunit alcohol dehydrogenase family)